ncbi:hypothetical protein A2872_01780 [Candidatus Gottesmanbacteria bacterium RIFCSPHIGHO2_01_FULL_42_12]|uniref:LytR/CpsA/Psr regulator C-terminal domain-containing protein n=1 Tax=Candidatus Gottesmanbacteria bacterium RIFCSPHIGHO2_01_FULL_42_12 TaxID=1798377 RepID=A0A1F5Z5E4_9BACT|nr:MAG: hypothetical protein A2872_01780 [Candidatus Gottesmanbacteria bacterium RIFCSPHIGHO2_01_FULL_42_12]
MDTLTLSRQWLDLNFDNKSNRLDFPPEVISNSEVMDLSAFTKLLNEFFETQQLKSRKLKMVLSTDLVFEKSFIVGQDEEEGLKKFYEEIPFPSEKILRKEIKQNGAITAIAVNNEILQAVINALKVRKISVSAVTPESLINTDFSLIGNAPASSKLNINYRSLAIFLAVLVIFGFGGFLGYRYLQSKKNVALEPVPDTQITPVPKDIEATPSSQVLEFKKREMLEIKVQNGSGKTGEAAKVRDELDKLGFSQIEIGNAATKSAITLVNLSINVSPPDQKEILTMLEKWYKSIKATTSAGLTSDVEIVIGL